MATYPFRLYIIHVLSPEKKFATETDWIIPGDSTLSGCSGQGNSHVSGCIKSLLDFMLGYRLTERQPVPKENWDG
jgi:hypothetical protein